MTQEEARQRIREIAERNKAVAPPGLGLWPPARLFRAMEAQLVKHFSELGEREPEGEEGAP